MPTSSGHSQGGCSCLWVVGRWVEGSFVCSGLPTSNQRRLKTHVCRAIQNMDFPSPGQLLSSWPHSGHTVATHWPPIGHTLATGKNCIGHTFGRGWIKYFSVKHVCVCVAEYGQCIFYQWPMCGQCVANVWPMCGHCVATAPYNLLD